MRIAGLALIVCGFWLMIEKESPWGALVVFPGLFMFADWSYPDDGV